MTTICFASLKGAPGVTTLATLIGAVWPAHRRPLVAECDPSGGDLAVRFRLSAKCGWSSFAAATRRRDGAPPLLPHLQHLPGGLAVMVGPRTPIDAASAPRLMDLAIEAASGDDGWDLLVDLGRLTANSPHLDWLDRADAVVIISGTDAPSVLHVHDRADSLLSRCSERLGLILVERVGYGSDEIEEFTGVPVLGQIPYDPSAAEALAGAPAGQRRLARSSFLAAGHEVALRLSGDAIDGGERSSGPEEPEPGSSGPVRSWAERASRLITRMDRRPEVELPLTSAEPMIAATVEFTAVQIETPAQQGSQ